MKPGSSRVKWRFGRALLGSAALCVRLLWAGELRAEPQRWLLAVGSNHGLAEDDTLLFAEHDADDFARVMQELGSVPAAHVRLLHSPSLAELHTSLSKLAAVTAADSTVFVYFSGHGSRDELHLAGAQLTRAELERSLSQIPARLRVLLVDACRGAKPVLRSKGFVPTAPIEIVDRTQRGLVVLHSAAPGEAANESERLQGGVFTHHLVQGLRGAADADGDARINVSEAYVYAYNQTRFETQSLQNPISQQLLEGSGPLVLTTLTASLNTALLTLPSDTLTHYRVYAKGSHAEVASAWAERNKTPRLALPPGRYVISRSNDRQTTIAEVLLHDASETRLAHAEFAPLSDGAVTSRGDAGVELRADGHSTRYPHALTAGVGILPSSQGPGPALWAAYDYITPRWALRSAGTFTRQQSQFNTNLYYDKSVQHTVELSAGAARRFVGTWAEVELGAGLTLQARRQELTLQNSSASRRATATAAGPYLDAAVLLPITPRYAWRLGARAQPVAFREGDHWQVEPQVLGLLGLRVGL
jgi:hypothetical protein